MKDLNIKSNEPDSVTTVVGEIICNGVLREDSDSNYVMYFKSKWNTPDAIRVEDSNENEIVGKISGRKYIPFTFDYAKNNQGDRVPNQDVEVVIIGIGLKLAKYIRITGTITKTGPNKFILESSPEPPSETS
jgi:hypothetical protein